MRAFEEELRRSVAARGNTNHTGLDQLLLWVLLGPFLVVYFLLKALFVGAVQTFAEGVQNSLYNQEVLQFNTTVRNGVFCCCIGINCCCQCSILVLAGRLVYFLVCWIALPAGTAVLVHLKEQELLLYN
ncbi:unnamed protein product [Amoebophrya sp. A120]|nr:unnamed protein product [Amoebophrya sp. A120]|eukprot:GSA120T00023174001.1